MAKVMTTPGLQLAHRLAAAEKDGKLPNSTQQRYRERELAVWRGLLSRWLSSLPPSGWEGTVDELELALVAIGEADPALKFRLLVPTGTGLGRRIVSSAHILEAAGWAVRVKRSRVTGRTLVFSRTGAK
jgi:hypothetical protein